MDIHEELLHPSVSHTKAHISWDQETKPFSKRGLICRGFGAHVEDIETTAVFF